MCGAFCLHFVTFYGRIVELSPPLAGGNDNALRFATAFSPPSRLTFIRYFHEQR